MTPQSMGQRLHASAYSSLHGMDYICNTIYFKLNIESHDSQYEVTTMPTFHSASKFKDPRHKDVWIVIDD